MFPPKMDYLRYQTRFAVHIAARDLAKRLATAVLILLLVLWVDGPVSATAIGSVIALYELLGALLYRRIADRDEDISPRYILAVWLVNWSSVIAYVWPAFVLAKEPSAALLLAGFLWLFGVFVHISNSFATLPFYNWSLMIPSFASAFVVFYLAARNQFLPGSSFEWAITTGLMGVYILNSLDTLHKQKDTQRALEAAREEAQQRLKALEYMSRHDPLTGLLNRRAFDEDLAKLLAQSPHPERVGVMLIDLDGFKPINDTHSHDAGDQLLREIGHRLKDVAREIGLAARLGGDEFIIAMPDLGSDELSTRLAELILQEVEQPFFYNQKIELRVSASIGIGICRHTGAEVEALCAAADKAMYRAKTSAAENVVLYSSDIFAPSISPQQRLALLAAVHQGDIRPAYDPIVAADDGTLNGVIAAPLWDRQPPGHDQVSDLKEAIRDIGAEAEFFATVVGHVAADFEKAGEPNLRVFVDLPSRLLLTPNGRSELRACIERLSGPIRKQLILTVRKSAFTDRTAATVIAGARDLTETGITFAMSGFGSGQMPIDAVESGLFATVLFAPEAVTCIGDEALSTARRRQAMLEGMVALVRATQATPVATGLISKKVVRRAGKAGFSGLNGPSVARADSLSGILSRQVVRRPKNPEGLQAING